MLGSRRFSVLLFVIFYGLHGVSWAQEGVVLDTRPDGIVVDVGQMPNVQQGAKLGFVRLEGVRKEIGQGTVLDVREGRALLQPVTASGVRQGDLVVLCPQPGQPDPYLDLRTMVDQLRAQATQSGLQSGSPILAMSDQLKLTLQARDAALQQGACDTAEFDRQISSLAMDLQSLSTGLQPVAVGPSPYQPTAPVGTAIQAQPPAAAAKVPGDSLDTLERISKIIERVVMAARFKGAPPSYSPSYPGGQYPPTYPDPGVGSAYPPGSSYPPGTYPDPSMGGQYPSPSYPTGPGQPVSPPYPPSSPPPQPQLATVQGIIKEVGGQPVGGAMVAAVEWNQTMTSAPDGIYYLQGPGGQVTIKATASGYQDASVVTMAAPGFVSSRSLFLQKIDKPGGVKPPTLVIDPVRPDSVRSPTAVMGPPKFQAAPAGPPALGAKKESEPYRPWLMTKGEKTQTTKQVPGGTESAPQASVPWWEVPKIMTAPAPRPQEATPPKSEVVKPAIGPLAKIRLATVKGWVLNERGQPVAGARVTAGAASSPTDREGKFSMNLTPGQHQLTATANGFQARTLPVMRLGEGEVKNDVNFSLQRIPVSPVQPTRPTTPSTPTAPARDRTRQQTSP